MYPHTPAPPMPGSLKAVRVLLIIRVVLAAIIYALAFLGLAVLAGLPSAQVEAELGMPLGVTVIFLVFGVALTAFEVYAIVAMGKGGFRAQTLLRVVVGIGLAGALINLFTGSNPALGIVLLVVVLVLILKQDSKDWFRATEPGAPGHPGGPGGHPPVQGGYPGGR